MRVLLFFIGTLLLLTAMMFIVNLTGIMPTSEYLKGQCTRYCHNSHCPHFDAKVEANRPVALKIKPTYQNAIYALQHNPFGMTYTTINLLVFVIGFPILILSLSYNLLKKWRI